jgi:hypothetical protein
MKIIIKTEEILFEIEKEYESDMAPSALKDMITKIVEETIKIKKINTESK